MDIKITYLPGDGIGPEVGGVAIDALTKIAERFDHSLSVQTHDFGGASIDKHGVPLTDEALSSCHDTGAVLLGAIGGPKWANDAIRPEQGLLKLRRELGTFANLRPVKTHPLAAQHAPLKQDILDNVDIMVVRELTGGIYFGEKTRTSTTASDLCVYTREEIERIIRMAASMAQHRRKKLTSVDKANVLETSRLWRDVTNQIMRDEFPDIEVEHLYIDAAAMHLLSRPRDFDVIVTENMFGDILTDEASMLAGSLGLLPSASLSDDGPAIYEPIHGSAPDIAGQNKANPMGMCLSASMLLRHSYGLVEEANYLEEKIYALLEDGIFTADLKGKATLGDVHQALMKML